MPKASIINLIYFILLSNLILFICCGTKTQIYSYNCGNNLVEHGEDCDGTDLNDMTCELLGLGNGILSCNENCTYNTSSCETIQSCGDNECTDGETSCNCPQDCHQCNGCCNGEECLPGYENNACGTGGESCKVCDQSQICSNSRCIGIDCGDGVCSDDETQCNCPQDCNQCEGCCRPDNACLLGDRIDACGFGGLPCESCNQDEDEICSSKRCIGPFCGDGTCSNDETQCNCPQDCNQCEGCCSGDTCLQGNRIDACGSGGIICTVCNEESGQVCSSRGCVDSQCGDGICSVNETSCNCPLDCSQCSGCCIGNICMSGDSSEACGTDGAYCDVCNERIGEICTEGNCVGPVCGDGICSIGETSCFCPLDCPLCNGCCRANICLSGDSNNACGIDGEVCDVCEEQLFEQCSDGRCIQTICGDGYCLNDETSCNCPLDCHQCNGCCNGDTCMSGDSVDSCGIDGSICQECSEQEGETCLQGSCLINLEWNWTDWRYRRSSSDGEWNYFETGTIAQNEMSGTVGIVGFKKDGSGSSSYGYAEKTFNITASGLRMWFYQSPTDVPYEGYARIYINGQLLYEMTEEEFSGRWEYIDVPFNNTLNNFTLKIGKWHDSSWQTNFYVSCGNLSFY